MTDDTDILTDEEHKKKNLNPINRRNYKKAFDVLLRNKALWKDRTDMEKKEIFKALNDEAGFNYSLESYKD